MKLAEKIQKCRKEKNLTQEQLAEKLDVSRQSVSKWEMEQAVPDIDKIIALSELFEVSTDYLLKEQAQQASPQAPITRIQKFASESAGFIKLFTIMGMMWQIIAFILMGTLWLAWKTPLAIGLGVGGALIMITLCFGVFFVVTTSFKISQINLSKKPFLLVNIPLAAIILICAVLMIALSF